MHYQCAETQHPCQTLLIPPANVTIYKAAGCHPFPSPVESGMAAIRWITTGLGKPESIEQLLQQVPLTVSFWVFRKQKPPGRQLGMQQKKRTEAHLTDKKVTLHPITNDISYLNSLCRILTGSLWSAYCSAEHTVEIWSAFMDQNIMECIRRGYQTRQLS